MKKERYKRVIKMTDDRLGTKITQTWKKDWSKEIIKIGKNERQGKTDKTLK